jgi:glyoxylase-like metal-dependent hydrolase (beta-lactamase superfamily II)
VQAIFRENIMTELTRRSVIAGAATGMATAMSPVASNPANAAAPATGKQTAGWYRYKVGDYEITVVTDGLNKIAKLPDNFVVNAPKEEVDKALTAAFLPAGSLDIPYSPIVVNTGSKLVLLDTGTGQANFATSKGVAGQFHTNLAAAGIDAKAIDTVIISHYHGDHINGLVMADGSSGFPNAEILVPAAEHKYWMDDAEMSKAPAGRMEGLFKNARRVFSGDVGKQVKQYEPGKEIAPGITSVATPGHTPGHSSHIVSSGGKTLFVQADVTNVPFLFVRNPGWHAFFDQDAKLAEATRRKTYDMLAADKMMMQGFHYPFPAVAFVEKSGSGYRETMVPWNPTI